MYLRTGTNTQGQGQQIESRINNKKTYSTYQVIFTKEKLFYGSMNIYFSYLITMNCTQSDYIKFYSEDLS